MPGVQVIHTIAELRAVLAERRRDGQSIGLVPTMGALHQGHGKLIEVAAEGSDRVVVSIFVNPIQFNDPRDYTRYPRNLDTDVRLAERCGAHIVFAPSAEEMYREPQQTFIEVAGISEHLCGKFRPGHFRGVATVVMKLFQIVQPDRAYFGEKDAQQLAVIRRMTADLNVPVEIIGVPTVREPDGLALSSRNQLLTPEQRRIAPMLYRALEFAQTRIAAGTRDSHAIQREAWEAMQHPDLRVEYLEIVDADSMQPVDRIEGPVRVASAVWLESVRLIDNVLATPGWS